MMRVLSTGGIEGKKIESYLGLVTGEAVVGEKVFHDIFSGISGIVGGKGGAYQDALQKAKNLAVSEMVRKAREMGGNTIIGVDLDYQTMEFTSGHNILMVIANGTAVVAEE